MSHKRHFYGANAARLARRSAELLDLAEDSIHLQRVLVENPALQHQRVGGAGAIPDLAESVHSLVGVNANDGARAGSGLHHCCHAHVRDPQRRRTGIGVDPFGVGLHRLAAEKRASQRGRGAFQNAAAIHQEGI